MPTRFGVIALAGRPNVGKSSLLNAIIDTPLAMVSPKAQATRIPVTGIHTQGDTQIVIRDLPGLLDPAYLMQKSMRAMALEALRDVNVVIHLHPATEAPAPEFATLVPDAPPFTARVLTTYTKSDLVSPARRHDLNQGASCAVSVHDPASVQSLIARIRAMLPEAPFQHDPDDIGTQPVRFFVGEYLREGAFAELGEEVPYSFAAEVDEFRETPKPVYIRATLFIERESQKGILIGHKGATLKKIGAHARQRLEVLLGERVYLETWVKVLPRWRRNATALARFGFPVPDDEKS
ncbi:MAG: GTPase Era [Gemmatimonadales bacterium]